MRPILMTATHVSEVLRYEYDLRKERNRTYSMRAFARDLRIAISRLSDAIHAKRGFSDATAKTLAERLGYSPHEAEMFFLLVQTADSRPQRIREEAIEKRKMLIRSHGRTSVPTENFSGISDWYHFAILELTYIDFGRTLTAELVHELLDIPLEVAQTAIQRLVDNGYLTLVDGNYRDTHRFLEVGEQIPSEAVRRFHKQLISKALTAIDSKPMDRRFVSSSLMAVRTSEIAEARNAIEDFRRDFGAKFGPDEEKSSDALCALTIQFHQLTEVGST